MAKKGSKKGSKKSAKKTLKKAARPVRRSKPAAKARKAPARATKNARPKAKKTPARAAKAKARNVTKRPAPKTAAKPVRKAVAPKARPTAKSTAADKKLPLVPPPTLQRERRRLPEAEEETFGNVTGDSRLMSSARSGHDELRQELKQHTEASPAMTAGDVDAKWQDAYALGDEAPGGDNMTPDQDRVDDIGKALGIEYADDEELLGGEELAERDEHRWELDPASKEDEDEEI